MCSGSMVDLPSFNVVSLKMPTNESNQQIKMHFGWNKIEGTPILKLAMDKR